MGSGNRKKLEELARILAAFPLTLVTPADFDPALPAPEEPHRTFLENAVEKAVRYARASGLPTLADDSGLEVDALDGLPGVDSAYYAGRPTDDRRNNEKLLAALEGIAPPSRTARYRCALALASAAGTVVFTTEGACEGRIALAPRGAAGFGYDPLFLVGNGDVSFGELPASEKDGISHRGRALRSLQNAFPDLARKLGWRL